MAKLRIAMISVHGNPLVPQHLLGSEGKGGQNIYVRNMGEALADLGHNVTWFTRSEDPQETGIKIISKYLRLQYLISGPQVYIHRDELFKYLNNFAEQIDSANFDIVFTNYWLSGYVGLCLNLPHVHAHHSLGKVKYAALPKIQWPSIAGRRLLVEEELNKTCDCIFNLNGIERKLCSPKRSMIVPIGINIERFENIRKSEAQKYLNFDSGVLNLLYVGRFAPQKGVKFTCKALETKDVRFKFRLIGNFREDMRIDPIEFPHFRFLGPKTQEEVSLYMTASDVVLIPSIYEPGGIVALEAMASGCVVVCSDVGGLSDVITNGRNGFKVPPKSPEAIKSAIEKIAESPEMVMKIARNNRIDSLKYTWKSSAQRATESIGNIFIETSKELEY